MSHATIAALRRMWGDSAILQGNRGQASNGSSEHPQPIIDPLRAMRIIGLFDWSTGRDAAPARGLRLGHGAF
jgi:hypothetical protein